MHEQSLIKNLLGKIYQLSALERKTPLAATIQLGALCHLSAEHFREHFVRETSGTRLAGMRLRIQEMRDIDSPCAQDVVLASLEFADSDGAR